MTPSSLEGPDASSLMVDELRSSSPPPAPPSEDDNNEDNSGSDSDAEAKSHILKSRRAGAKLKSKRAGLLSFV